MRSLIFAVQYIFLVFLLVLISIVLINRHNVAPTDSEIGDLKTVFENIEIRDQVEIFRIQNKVISEIEHVDVSNDNTINIQNVLLCRKGLCYDRSMILQKIMIYNGFSIRPVYLFFNIKRSNTSYLDFFGSEIDSHAIFEFKLNGKWYVMQTNHPMFELIDIDDYILKTNIIPKHSRYIRHLSNRNMRFVEPTWLPDIY